MTTQKRTFPTNSLCCLRTFESNLQTFVDTSFIASHIYFPVSITKQPCSVGCLRERRREKNQRDQQCKSHFCRLLPLPQAAFAAETVSFSCPLVRACEHCQRFSLANICSEKQQNGIDEGKSFEM